MQLPLHLWREAQANVLILLHGWTLWAANPAQPQPWAVVSVAYSATHAVDAKLIQDPAPDSGQLAVTIDEILGAARRCTSLSRGQSTNENQVWLSVGLPPARFA